jgi:hypothetical protein
MLVKVTRYDARSFHNALYITYGTSGPIHAIVVYPPSIVPIQEASNYWQSILGWRGGIDLVKCNNIRRLEMDCSNIICVNQIADTL